MPTLQEIDAEISRRERLSEIDAEISRREQSPGSIGEQFIGAAENVGSLIAGAVAGPISGLAGIAQSLNPLAEQGAGARAVELVGGAITDFAKPETPIGISQQESIAETLAPVGEIISSAESFLGDNTLRITGSPALAAIAHSLPTATMEFLGIKGSKQFTKAPNPPSKREIKKSIIESSPEVEIIKKAASAIYKEIDDSGVTVKQGKFKSLVSDMDKTTKKAGIDQDVTPKASGAMKRFKSELGEAKTLTDIDTLRKVAQGVANQLDSTESALGNTMINQIDDFMDTLKQNDLTGGFKAGANTGKKFKTARKLWGRARRSELIQDAITTGESRAAGAEAGIRNEFNRLLNNKKTSKFIPESEKKIIRALVKGDFKQNFTRLIGKVGLSIDRSPNVFGSIVAGGGLGSLIGGGAGAVLVPLVGTISKQIAQKLTRSKASFVKKMTLAGSDGEKIVKAYLTSVPKSKRNSSDLSDLLSDPNVNIDDLEFIANETVRDAIDLAKGKRAINLASGALSGSLTQEVNNQQGDNR